MKRRQSLVHLLCIHINCADAELHAVRSALAGRATAAMGRAAAVGP
jgi:hypothetical protein